MINIILPGKWQAHLRHGTAKSLHIYRHMPCYALFLSVLYNFLNSFLESGVNILSAEYLQLDPALITEVPALSSINNCSRNSSPKFCWLLFSSVILRGPTTFFFTNFGHNNLFFGEKVSSGIWETCPKILGGYVYQNPPNGGIYIYI